MLFRFGGDDGELLGRRAMAVTGDDFASGTDHDARIELWAEEAARGIVKAGESFTVWCGGDVVDGVVASVD